MLQVQNVTVRVRSRALLEQVSFEALPGEVVGIIGPNGAGKSTLLEVMAGLRRADAAVVTFRDEPLRDFADRARTFVLLPDRSELPAELTVGELVDFTLGHRARRASLVDDLRTTLALERLLAEPCGVLSRGERQRVALFCSLAVERPVVLLDEPFSAFDPSKLRGVLAAVRRVAASGAVVVASMHQLTDAEKAADRLLLLSEGRRVAWGDLASLRELAGLPRGTLEEVFVALLAGEPRAP